MADIIVIIIILAIIAGAITKVVIEKRSGNKCIGCPHGKSGSRNCGCDSAK
jgi:hypothetical protein